jgi:hypothetical protein
LAFLLVALLVFVLDFSAFARRRTRTTTTI